jgi:hypothetical protein
MVLFFAAMEARMVLRSAASVAAVWAVKVKVGGEATYWEGG